MMLLLPQFTPLGSDWVEALVGGGKVTMELIRPFQVSVQDLGLVNIVSKTEPGSEVEPWWKRCLPVS